MTPEEARARERALISSWSGSGATPPRVARRDRMGWLEAAGWGALDGFTLGFADEIGGLFNDGWKRQLRNKYARAAQDQAGAFGVGQFGSAFIPGLGILGSANRIARLGSRLAGGGRATTQASNAADVVRQMRAGAGGAGLTSATFGFGTAEGDALERLPSAIGAGVTGLALGASFPLASALLMKTGKVAHAPIRQGMQALGGKPDTARAEAALFERLRQDFGEDAGEKLLAAYRKDRRRGGSAPALLDITGENVSRLTEYAASVPGPGRNAMRTEVQRRIGQQQDMVEKAVTTATGGSKMFRQTIDELDLEQQQIAGPLYARLQYIDLPIDKPVPVQLDRTGRLPARPLRLGDILQRPGAQSAMRRAIELAQDRGLNLAALGIRLDSNGQWMLGSHVNLSAMDLVKQALDDMILTAKNPLSGFGRNQLGAIKQTTGEFVRVLDGLTAMAGHPGAYAQARNAYAGVAQLKNAAELGRDVFTPKSHSDFMADIGELLYPFNEHAGGRIMQEANRQAAIAGLRDALLERAMNARDGADLWKQTLGNPNVRTRIASVFGPIGKNGGYPRKAQAFFAKVRQEAERLLKINEVYSRRNSQTTPRMIERDDVDAALGEALVNVLTGDVRGAAVNAWGTALRGWLGKSPLTPREGEHLVARAIAPIRNEQSLLDLAAQFKAWEARRPPPAPHQARGARAASRAIVGSANAPVYQPMGA